MPAYSSENILKTEDSLGYHFNEKKFLIEALTHSSYANEHPGGGTPYNERLEFLGDAVLGLAVVEALYFSEEELTESDMAKMKSFLVSRTVLSEAARELDLGSAIRLGRGEEGSGGRGKDNILADAMEAVFGAIFVDGGYDAARDVVLRILDDRIEEAVRTKQSYDYKTELQERTQNKYGTLPVYNIIREEGEEHDKTFTVEVFVDGVSMGSGVGRSKKEAQMKAAKEALEVIDV